MDSTERFKVLAAAALMDGTVGAQEHATLLKAARELGLSAGAAQAILEETKRAGDLAARIPSDPRERATLFRALVDVVSADGVIEKNELSLVTRLGPAFGLKDLEVEDLLRAAVDAKKNESQRLKKKT
jgi:uncharacterized tellurite resistance protein B-like protein